jgi:sorbitol/mannitol transport system substrate-binding protein
VPPGSRYSTYSNPNYKKAAAAFATPTLNEINGVNVSHPGVSPQPYVGVQYVGIPQFEDLGTRVSQEITAATDTAAARAAVHHRGHADPVPADHLLQPAVL